MFRFGWSPLLAPGAPRLRLRRAPFCRVRPCPVCPWRRPLLWPARFSPALPPLVVASPSSRWLFLPFPVRPCALGALGPVLPALPAAFQRLAPRPALSPVPGWLRAPAVPRGPAGRAPPPFPCLLMVPPSWFQGTNYVKHERWVELWRDCLRVNYEPNIDIRAVKTKTGEVVANVAEQLQSAVAET
ncbi:protein rep, partial [Escherichia coli]|uniref:protein rep n=1 Tax=Escherichia coli TaxID=562 RepID=UPI0020370C3B